MSAYRLQDGGEPIMGVTKPFSQYVAIADLAAVALHAPTAAAQQRR
jgi:hypothetical protein